MKIPTTVSIYSLRRTEFVVTALTFGILIALFCVVVLPALMQESGEGDSSSRSFARVFAPWFFGTQVILNLCRVYPNYLWSRAAGLLSERARGWWWLDNAPWFCLYTVAFLLFWDCYQPVSPLWLALWIPPTVAVFCSLGAGGRERYDGGKLQAALTPAWPAGTPGAEPWETGSVVRELQILIVREVPDTELLRFLSCRFTVSSLRIIPEADFVDILCEVYPRIRTWIPEFLGVGIESTEFESIDSAIESWGWRSDWPWQGELDDGTILVRNDGEIRIVPASPGRYEQYRRTLLEHGRDMGLDKFYLQTGGESVVVRCAALVADESGAPVPPVC